MRKLEGDNIVIWGGILGVLFSPQYAEEGFEQHLNKVLDEFADDARFVLGIDDQVPPDGVISRTKKVRDIIDKRSCTSYA
ncbi:MAG TPA: hypothetical protein GXX37_01120 [Clostridiaceae bacterium]|nr:hypothetical protein [Clostridiaceae bacterium]